METHPQNIVTTAGFVNGQQPAVAQGNALAQAIREIAWDRGLEAFDKPRRIADLVETDLKRGGSFCRTRDGRSFYFPGPERRLLDLQQEPFLLILKRRTGLASSERFFRFVLDHLRNQAARLDPIEVHTLSYFDPKSRVQYVSDGGGGIWKRELRGEWTPGLNGEEQVFFITDSDADTWVPDFTLGDHARDDFYWFVERFPFSSSATRLNRDDQINLMSIFLENWFFPALRRTRMIPVFLGNNATIALRLLGRLFVGHNFQVSDIRASKLRALYSLLSNRSVVALREREPRDSLAQGSAVELCQWCTSRGPPARAERIGPLRSESDVAHCVARVAR